MIIAQISDIHAAADNDNLQRLERALAWLATLAPDALVLTGDLADNRHCGHDLLAACLNAVPWPLFILPGNADNRDRLRAAWPERFADKRPALHFTANIGGIRLIGLDSTLENSDAGSVAAHLGWLDQALNASPALPSILFLHHHLFLCGIPGIDNSICHDRRQLETLLRNSMRPPLAIACGHVHRPMMSLFAGIPAYVCGSVCAANPLWFGADTVPPVNDPVYLLIHRFNDGELVSYHVAV